MNIVHRLDVDGPASFGCAQSGCRVCLEALMEHPTGLIHSVLRRPSSGSLRYAEALPAGRMGLWQLVALNAHL
jgi:hypothetical protein